MRVACSAFSLLLGWPAFYFTFWAGAGSAISELYNIFNFMRLLMATWPTSLYAYTLELVPFLAPSLIPHSSILPAKPPISLIIIIIFLEARS